MLLIIILMIQALQTIYAVTRVNVKCLPCDTYAQCGILWPNVCQFITSQSSAKAEECNKLVLGTEASLGLLPTPAV